MSTNSSADDSSVSPLQDDTNVNEVNGSEVPIEVAPQKTLCSCGEPRLPSAIFCPHCGQDFAEVYSSAREPVVDEDGTTHSGQRIRLIGEGWPNDMFMISDPNVTDEVLQKQIAGLQTLLKRAIQTTDYCKISIAAREFELDYRQHSRYVAAVRRREKLTTQGTIRLNQKAHRAGSTAPKIPADIAALMSLGLSYDQAVLMKATLGKAKT
jgi:hypothetical protein